MGKRSRECGRAAQTHFQLDRKALRVNEVLDRQELVKQLEGNGLSSGKKDYGMGGAQWLGGRWQR